MWGSFRLAEKYGIGGVFSIAVGLLPVQERVGYSLLQI